MFIRGMVDHQVHDDPDSPLLCLSQEFFHIGHVPKDVSNGLIIRNIITVVIHGRLVNRREPDGRDPQFLQVIQLTDNPLQVTDSIPITVHKGLGIDLINASLVPPVFFHT